MRGCPVLLALLFVFSLDVAVVVVAVLSLALVLQSLGITVKKQHERRRTIAATSK